MDQIQNGTIPEFLQHLVANPAAANQTHRQQLETLVQTYPACSVFRLLLAKAAQNTDAETAKKAVQSAAVYAANREVLFKLIHQPETIAAVKAEKFYPFISFAAEQKSNTQDAVFTIEKSENNFDFPTSYPVSVPDQPANIEETVFAEDPSAENNNAAFIGPELEVVAAIPVLADSVSAENNDAVFIDPNLPAIVRTENPAEEIDPLEITDAAYIEPEPAAIEDAEAVFVEDIPSAENRDAVFTDENLAENKVEVVADLPSAENNNAVFTDGNLEEAMAAENDFRVEDVSQTFVNEADEELVFPEQTILASEENFDQKPINQEIDEEVFDEITAIEDINFDAVKTVPLTLEPPKPIAAEPENQPEIISEPETTSEEKPLTARDEAEKAMLSNIASIDYFTFNTKFGQNQTVEPSKKPSEEIDYQTEPVAAKPEPLENEAADTVSKYHDDKMPYTFMWWLDRTRKEYAETYQPYTKNVQKSTDISVGPELHKQYIESIFHTKAPLKVPENVLPPMEELPVKKKEKQLIERFIVEEPHIHPPSMDKLDTENKAKRSSEDADVLVTETLAKVYLDQMLYHKALDTYKKLMLKFPEKSVYFAAQLTEIEKKIN